MAATVADVLQSLKFKRSELEKVAESVCVALAEDPQSVDPSDRVIFHELQWTERDIAREVGKCQSRKQWKHQAGTNAQYAESVETLAAVAKTVPEKVRSLQIKIDELQSKIDDERSKLHQAEQAVETYEHARAMLRQNVPPFIRKQYDDELALIRSSEEAERMRALQQRRNMITKVLSELSIVDAETLPSIRLHCEACLPSALPPPSRMLENLGIDQYQWHNYLEKLRQEMPGIVAELSELEHDFAERLAFAETILDYYLEGK